MPITCEYDTVWDSDYLSHEIDEKGKPRWNCKHCGGTWSGQNYTKALYHVCKVPGADIKPCRGMIPEDYSRRYQKVLAQKVKGADSRKKQENIIHLDLDRREDDTLAFLQMAKSSRPRSPYKVSGDDSSSLKCPPELLNPVDLTDPDEGNFTSPHTSSISTELSVSSGGSTRKQKVFNQSFINLADGKTAPKAKEGLDIAIAHYLIAKQRPFYEAEEFLFSRILSAARLVNSTYKPPGRNEIGGDLQDATYLSYYQDELCKLLKDANVFGLAIYGDGATIKTVAQINILAASPNNPGCVLDVVDCSKHMSVGGKNDATYISNAMLPLMTSIDPNKRLFNVIAFDGASNEQ